MVSTRWFKMAVNKPMGDVTDATSIMFTVYEQNSIHLTHSKLNLSHFKPVMFFVFSILEYNLESC